MPSAPANLQLPWQETAEGLMLPLLTFYSCTLPHSAIIGYKTNHLLQFLLLLPSPGVMTGTICKLCIVQLRMQGVTCRDWILFPSSTGWRRKGSEGRGEDLWFWRRGLRRGQGWKFPPGSPFQEELLEFIFNYTQE